MTTLDLDEVIAALPEAVTESMRRTLPDHYTPEAAAAIAETMTGILTGTICPVWPGICTETKPGHDDHWNYEQAVTTENGEHLLDIGFVQSSDGGAPIFYIGGLTHEDYRPGEIREKTAELRQLLDRADEMADLVIRMQQARA